MRSLSLTAKVAKLRDPAYQAQMIQEAKTTHRRLISVQIFVLPKGEVRYDLGTADSLQTHADRLGVSPGEAFIALSLDNNGETLFNYPFLNPQFDAVQHMLDHPQVVIGLGDSGAHCGQIMDSSLPTYFLKYWVKERAHFALEQAIHMLTAEPAQLFGIHDRGTLRARRLRRCQRH